MAPSPPRAPERRLVACETHRCSASPPRPLLAACGGAPKGTDDTAAVANQQPTTAAVGTVTVPPLDVDAIDSLIQRVVADKGLVGLSVGVMQDGKVVLARGYGYRSLDPKLPGHADHHVRHRLGDQAVHLQRGAPASAGRQAVDERQGGQVRPHRDARQRHHAPRPRAARLGLPRLLSARLRGAGDGQARADRHGHRSLCNASARLRAALALVVQQHQLPHPRQGDRAGFGEGRRDGLPGAHLWSGGDDAHRVRSHSRRHQHRERLHVVCVGRPVVRRA